MQKLLYITDQDEYVDHSFIAPLFEIYLKKHMHIDIVYFTEYKSDFEHKETHRFTVPSRYKNVLLAELKRNNINLASYDYIMVRNNIHIMKHVLKHKDIYHYKTAYRFSFPKRRVKLCCDEAENKKSFFSHIIHRIKTKQETNIINQCDVFLPTSAMMHKIFLPQVNIPTIICPPGINPAVLHENMQHDRKEKCFIYAGTLDKMREFETILDAFSSIENKNWKLFISTRDTEYALHMIQKYTHIKDHIKLHNAKTKEALLSLIAKADVGIALLPDKPIYTTSTPVKIFDYYASAVPCLMTLSEHTSTIFTDCKDAWFCNFTQEDIKEKIEYILSLDKQTLMEVGESGQQQLLEMKNYKTIAKEIATKLQAL